MGEIIKFIVTLLSFSMFFLKREQKLAVMMIYGICFMSVQARYLIPPLFFFLSEIPHWREYVNVIKKFKLTIFVTILFLGTVLLILHSPHLRGTGQLLSYLRTEIITKYLLIIIPLVALSSKGTLSIVVKAVTVSMIILTLFGIYNLLTRHAIFVDWIFEGMKLNDVMEDAGSTFEIRDRFRVQALHFNPFDYGFICVTIWNFFLYLRIEKIVDNIHFLLISFCCLFGVIFCGCRTITVCLVFCFALYYLFTHTFFKTFKWVFIIIVIALFFYNSFSTVTEAVNAKLLSIFNDSADVDGSSISMRILQFTTVLYYIEGYFLFGRGFGFFALDLGWSEGKSGAVDRDLYGLEGVYLSLLLERGVIGLLMYAAMIFVLIKRYLSYRRADKNSTAYCLSLIFTYLLFAIMTGELQSAYITFLLLGIGMKLHYMKVGSLT